MKKILALLLFVGASALYAQQKTHKKFKQKKLFMEFRNNMVFRKKNCIKPIPKLKKMGFIQVI
jgi:hypothetical protein